MVEPKKVRSEYIKRTYYSGRNEKIRYLFQELRKTHKLRDAAALISDRLDNISPAGVWTVLYDKRCKH